MKLVVSGVHSDVDPSPGIGIARSVREAFPDATLIAVDYSVRSSGLHHEVFDDFQLQPPWNDLDLQTYELQIRHHLAQTDHCWISGLDVEGDWLASQISEHPRLLVPSQRGQTAVRKPEILAAEDMAMSLPPSLPAIAPPDELSRLGRRSGWKLWVKGKYHEAYAANHYVSLRHQIDLMAAHWPLEDVFVQAHIFGHERSVAFSSYEGRLLGAVEVEKRAVTSRGKTWSASISSPEPAFLRKLVSFVERTGWTGGGEVEFVRDESGEDWLIDFNPRFPAYIYGVTLCGQNLPAALLAAATNRQAPVTARRAYQFTRVVHEIPVLEQLPVPQIVAGPAGVAVASKHPSSQPALVKVLKGTETGKLQMPAPYSEPPAEIIEKLLEAGCSTPIRLRDEIARTRVVQQLEDALRNCEAYPHFIPALSIKTDPSSGLEREFLKRGWMAEAISTREYQWAKDHGFVPTEIVFNGPKLSEFVAGNEAATGIAFADSLEAFDRLVESERFSRIGVRLNPSNVPSRFGIKLGDFSSFSRLAQTIGNLSDKREFGVHFHFANDVCGVRDWEDLFEHMLVWADSLSNASGKSVSFIDIGGGWHFDDFEQRFLPQMRKYQGRVRETLPCVHSILLEPGKALASQTAWLGTTIIEVRAVEDDECVVVDAAISDLPMASFYPEAVFLVRPFGRAERLGGGTQRVLGSICMETDILLSGISFPFPPQVGDRLLFSGAGGYNASMAWPFAGGVTRDN